MLRRLFLLILLGVLAFSIPTSREYLLEATEPARAWAMKPFWTWVTHQRMDRILEDLRTHEAVRGNLPVRRGQFESWLNDRYRSPEFRVDGWGHAYRLEVTGGVMRITSPGRDGEFGTEDDLVREGPRAERRR